MYFDVPAEAFEQPIRVEMSAIMTLSGIFTLFFFIYPAPILAGAQAAAQALMP